MPEEDLGVVGRDDPAHHHRRTDPGGTQAVQDVGHQLHMGAREDGEPDDVDVLVAGRRHDLCRRQPDALVDHLEAGVAGRHGDLLGPVGVAVQPGLGHQQARRPPGRRRQGTGPGDQGRQVLAPATDPTAHPGRGPELAEDLPQGSGPLARRSAGMGQGNGGLHDVGVGAVVLGHPAQGIECLVHRVWSRPARHRSTSAICSASTRWSTFKMFSMSPSAVRGEGAVSVKQFTPTTCCSPVSIRRTRSAWLRTSRVLSSSMAANAPPSA